ncbi:MAG TPA: acyl-CoA dehydrogenase [Frankiaceae bacterium]|nr:acyl-CoA dehydrogenase [Frankiaceae bacterium]
MSSHADLRRWWQAQRRSDAAPDQASPETVARTFHAAVRDGILEMPLPGSGQTSQRWAQLSWWGGTDLSVARLVEGHVDAVAILAELAGPALPAGTSSAVWAAEPPGAGVEAKPTGDGWDLSGTKAWCSGASSCDTALLTATTPAGSQLFVVDLGADGIVRQPRSWRNAGMAASDTESVEFAVVPATAVGPPGSYLSRPGFWIGGIGVAAVWWGGAAAVARPLRAAAAADRAGPHALAHLGRIRTLLDSCAALLESAAQAVDREPRADHEALAVSVRSAVADAASEVLDRVGRALGPAPLAAAGEHAQRVADLTVYLRQHHAERDLARLGELDGLTFRKEPTW